MMTVAERKAFCRGLAAFTAATIAGGAALPALAQDPALLEEILVTARKKEESIQEVPVAVTAISASMIQSMNLQNLDDIAKVTAGLTFDPEFSRTSNRPVIRGQANILGDSGVSYFIDGVYITGSINDYDINDIERMEVVKGPQSALYGRNTYSGAINIITKSPQEGFNARAQIQVSDDDQQQISASISGKAGAWGFGLTGRYYELDSPWTTDFDNRKVGQQESSSLSGVLMFEPGERFSGRLRAYYNQTRDGQPPLFAQPASFNNCFEDNGSLYAGLGRYYCGKVEPRSLTTDFSRQAPDARDENDTLQVSLALDFGLTDNLTLTSITGYNKVDSAFVVDGDYDDGSFAVANFTPTGFPFAGFPVPPFDYGYVGSIADFTFASEDTRDDISQELRLRWELDRSEYLLGAYYFGESVESLDVREIPEGGQDRATAAYFAEFGRMQGVCAANPICGSIVPFFGPNIVVPRNANTLDTTNTAIFGMAAFDLNDATRLTFEARWQREEIDQVAVITDLDTPPEEVETVTANATFDAFKPRITIDHQVSDNHLIYGLVASGTKPGGFNGPIAIDVGRPTYDEEDVVAVEFGSKNIAFEGQLVANFALYYNQIEGYQLTQNVRTETNTVSAITNAGDADIFGLEAEFVYNPAWFQGLTLIANYAFTNAEFVDGTDENLGLLQDVADDGLVNCSQGNEFPEDEDCTSAFGDITGKKIPRVSEHQLFVDAEYRGQMGRDWEWFVGANYSYESSRFAQVVNLAETGDMSLVSARLGFTNGRWLFSLWGKNLTDEDTSPLVLRYADGLDSFKRSFVGTARRPRYVGVTAAFSF
jgi:outer membrane receptor protein involved in Fe transport